MTGKAGVAGLSSCEIYEMSILWYKGEAPDNQRKSYSHGLQDIRVHADDYNTGKREWIGMLAPLPACRCSYSLVTRSVLLSPSS